MQYAPQKSKKRDTGEEMLHLQQGLNIEKTLKALISTAREKEVTPEMEEQAISMYDRLAEIDPVGARYWRKKLDEIGIDTSYPEEDYSDDFSKWY